MDTIRYALENGEQALKMALEKMNLEELRKVIRENDLDPVRQYRTTKKVEKLREVILVVTSSRLHKGDGFI